MTGLRTAYSPGRFIFMSSYFLVFHPSRTRAGRIRLELASLSEAEVPSMRSASSKDLPETFEAHQPLSSIAALLLVIAGRRIALQSAK
jgi:hypothetical protein